MILRLARKLMGRARMPPTTVPRMAIQTVSISRYGTPSVVVENSRFRSGLTRPQKMPLATSVPLTASPLNVMLEADQLSSSAMMNTTSVYIHHLRGRDSYFSRIEFEYCMISLP